MATRHFQIEIKADSMEASSSESAHGNSRRPGVNLAVMGFGVLMFLWLTFRVDRYGYTLWRYLAVYPHNSSTYKDNVFGLVMGAILCGMFFLAGLRAFFPSGETMHCDRSTLTVSKIPWISFNGRWHTREFVLSEVTELCFGVLQSGRGDSIYGIRFVYACRKQKMLAGVTAPQAYKILSALKSLGADVPAHHDMRYVVREALRDQREQL
jgi:hypothetical protein